MNKVGLGINMTQILHLLSASLYKGDVVEVATRELLQNSFDAVKNSKNQKIDITWKDYERKLICTDTGVGMSPETVRDVFLTVGGTLKEGLDPSQRSGGFGIAKVAFFMSAERIELNTVKNGIRSYFNTSRESLLNGECQLKSEPTDEMPGTKVILTFPEYVMINGEKKRQNYSSWHAQMLAQKPLLDYNQIVTWNNVKQNVVDPKWLTANFQFDWGLVKLTYNPFKTREYTKLSVHCSGLYQFTKERYSSHHFGIEGYVNIYPKYPAGDNLYPFANSRDNFSASVSKDIDTIFKYVEDIGRIVRHEELSNEFGSLTSLNYIPVDGKNNEMAIREDTRVPAFSQEFINALIEAFKECSSIYEECKLAKEAAKEELSSEEINCRLKLHNPQNVSLTQNSYEALSKIASAIFDFSEEKEVRDILGSVDICGISLDKSIYGQYVQIGGKRAIYLSPIHNWETNGEFATRMALTLIHEFSHVKEEYHDEGFDCLLESTFVRFYNNGLFSKYYGKFLTIFNDYMSELSK